MCERTTRKTRHGIERKNRPNYKTISNPKYNMLIQLLMKPMRPGHVGGALNSDLREYWIQAIYN